MSTPSTFAKLQQPGEHELLRNLVEGTAGATGDRFFRVLVDHLQRALGTSGAWLATFDEATETLHAIAFKHKGEWVEGYSYTLAGTPCETAMHERRCVHVPERIVELYPNDRDLPPADAMSYLGVPLFDAADRIIGQLAVLDTKPMPADPEALAVFRIFASRAAAELQRIASERAVREREAQLSRLFESAMDAIVTLSANFDVVLMNPAGRAVLGTSSTSAEGNFRRFLSDDSRQRLTHCAEQLRQMDGGRTCLWVPGRLALVLADGRRVEAEATLSHYQTDGQDQFTLILRNVEDRLEAERRIQSLAGEAEYLREELNERGNFDGIIGSSPALMRALEDVERVAPVDTSVLLLGETGTGKELFARSIHASSRRRNKPLIRVNCGAIPANLIESELFGHECGAFTGATNRREGRFALADGGTLFLDEIGELPLSLQPKLLRVLQEGEFEAVGSSRTRRVDVRVIAATHRDLAELVAKGEFREDLYYRLNVFPIRVPPLRDRLEDVPELARAFVEKYARRLGRTLEPLTPRDCERLAAYPWPGNVRELQNVIERGVIVSRNGVFDLDRALPGVHARPALETRDVDAIHTMADLAKLERDNILRALARTNWKVSGASGAAELLEVNPSTLNSRMRALGLRKPKAERTLG